MGRTALTRMVTASLAALLLAAAGLLVPSAAAAAPPGGPPSADPSVPGPHDVTVAEYDGGPTIVTDPQGLTYAAEIAGVAHYPSTGDGPFPVVLYLHGNHATCSYLGVEFLGYPCPTTPVVEPVLNYRGYDYLGENLASHGYITFSIDANAVNTYNLTGDRGSNERAQLIARTLDLIADFDAGTAFDLEGVIGDDLVDRVDLTRIGMMGHSRGGEGVTEFIEDNENRDPLDGPMYDIAAVLSLAGTDYNLPRASGTHFGTILPLCDGDVHDLQSVFANDRHRFDAEAAPYARHIISVAGTNHNFYNTTWTNDDFSTSPNAGKCSSAASGSIRLSDADTRRMGITFINGFLRRYVGDELAFDSLLTGESALPASACPGGVGPCDALVGRSYLAPDADRYLVATPTSTGDPLAVTDDGAAVTATGFDVFSFCDPQADNGADGNTRDPGTNSGCPSNPYRSRARAYTLTWSGPARLDLAVAAQDVSGFDMLTFRTAANFVDPELPGGPTDPNPGDGATDLQVVVTDANGTSATVTVAERSDALTPMLPDVARQLTMNGVVVPLAEVAAQGVDLTHVTTVSFVAGDTSVGQPATGSVQLAEIGFQRNGFDDPDPVVPEGPLPLAASALALAVACAALSRRRRPAI